MKTANRTYRYAVVPSQGCYGSGSSVRAAYRTDSLERAEKRAAKLTADYRRDMAPYGYTSGGYRVVRWGSADRTCLGCDLDRYPTA
jgi:hypothetical protein